MTEQNKQQAEPVAWLFEGEGWGREVMMSEQEAIARKERLSRTWNITITPLYATEQNKQSDTPSPSHHLAGSPAENHFVDDYGDDRSRGHEDRCPEFPQRLASPSGEGSQNGDGEKPYEQASEVFHASSGIISTGTAASGDHQ
jgi:hypothetical protein